MNEDVTGSRPDFLSTPIRDLKLSIAGSRLEPMVARFFNELDGIGLAGLHPRVYLSTEWGVPDGTLAMAIPFYLASDDLIRVHAERVGYVEGRTHAETLRYLRHEMGHVVNYAYRLFDTKDWEAAFGSMKQAYEDDYRPEPFSRDFVRHLPGWYAQKHPDEDWAETFAVWMTPGRDWKAEYAGWPAAMAKLAYCDRTMAELIRRPPLVACDDLDEDVSEIAYSIEEYYAALADLGEPLPPGLDSALRSIFDDLDEPRPGISADAPRRPASRLIRQVSDPIAIEVYRWTGHFPERTRPLLHLLAERADAMSQVYPESEEAAALIGLTTLVTAMASNHVAKGRYLV